MQGERYPLVGEFELYQLLRHVVLLWFVNVVADYVPPRRSTDAAFQTHFDTHGGDAYQSVFNTHTRADACQSVFDTHQKTQVF